MKHLTLWFLLGLLFFATACGAGSSNDNVLAAENALANKDFPGAQKICTTIVEKDSLNDLDAGQLCRMSILFMELSEHADEELNVAMATRCFHKAMETDADSAVTFFSNLTNERQQWFHILSSLNRTLGVPQKELIESDEDSMTHATQSEIDEIYKDSYREVWDEEL